MLQTITPIDNSIYVERNYATDTEIEKVLQSSFIAQKNWLQIPLGERKKYILNFVDNFETKEKVS